MPVLYSFHECSLNNDDVKTSELFETPPFLEQRLGPEIFREIPPLPGIYRFYDENNTLLYVGKAKNLRRRLFTYKCAKAGRTSSKESKLISKINRFEFDILESEQHAILQENYWIREHRPEFNHANKHTETYYFITMQWSESCFVFGLTMNQSGKLFPEKPKPLYETFDSGFHTEFQSKIYGCYKGHRTVRTSLGALLQLLWMAEFGSISPHFLPVQLSRNLTPMRFKFPVCHQKRSRRERLKTMLDSWFLGDSPELLQYLQEKNGQDSDSVFLKNFVDGHIEILENYFQRNLQRYKIMRGIKCDDESHLIDQTELDDLMTKIHQIPQQKTGN